MFYDTTNIDTVKKFKPGMEYMEELLENIKTTVLSGPAVRPSEIINLIEVHLHILVDLFNNNYRRNVKRMD